MKATPLLILAAVCSCLIYCTEKESPGKQMPTGPVTVSDKHKFTVDTITTSLKNPCGMVFLPDGRILITDRAGSVNIVKDGKLINETVQGLPEVYVQGQGGLLDIQLHPDYETNGWIYLSYAKPGVGGGGTTIARAKLENNTFVEWQDLFTAKPYTNAGQHFGSRIVFDGNGFMYFSCGERGTKENAQKLENHLGKIMRLRDDGQIPSDNPFTNTIGAKSEIWSYGHRNPQGLVYDKTTESLYDVEHGPKGGDELNKIEKGKNYGWPVITWGIDYNGEPISDIQEKEGMQQPLRYWVPSIAPCGAMQVSGDKFPNWKGNILIGALALTHVARVELQDGKFVKEEKVLDKIGRVRAIAESPEGFIYVATEGPGMLVKLIPAD